MRKLTPVLFLTALALIAGGAPEYRVFATGFLGTENLAFDGKGNLYVSDTSTLWRADAEGKTSVFYRRNPETDGISLGGVSMGPEGKVYFSAGNRIMILDPAPGEANLAGFVDGFTFANGNCFDDAGNFYVADSQAKILYVVPAGSREKKVLVEKAGFINGLIWRRDDNTLYSTISTPGKVVGYRLGDGPVVKETVTIASLPTQGLDDLTIDAAGNLYVCSWLNGNLFKITMDGKKQTLFKHLDGPSAVEFAPGTGNLYICIKGGSTKFEGTEVVVADVGGEGYRQPFMP